MARRDVGQAVGLILIAVTLIASIAVAVGSLGVRLVHRSQAQNAADAAALAGATGGRDAAARVAVRNDGALIEYSETVDDQGILVVVVVDSGGEHASARASTAP